MISISSRARRAATAPRRGLTIVELIVAIMVLSIGLLALASTAGYVMKMMSGGEAQSLASQVAQSRFDSLASVPCDKIAAAGDALVVSGAAATRGITESWTAQRVNNGNMVRVTNLIRVPGRTQSYQYTGMRACR